MRILEIIPTLTSGGAERFVVDLCNALSKTDEVMIVTLFPMEKDHAFYLKDLYPGVQVKSLNKRMGMDFSVIKPLKSILKSFNPDIVHSHILAFPYVALAALFFKKKFFHTIHSDAFAEAGGGISRTLRKLMFKYKKFIPVTISEESHESFKKLYGGSTHIIYNGREVNLEEIKISDAVARDIDEYRNKKDKPIILNVARLVGLKRQNLIANVCKRLHEEGFDFEMIFMGRIEDVGLYEEIESLNLPYIHILGEKPNILEYLKIADGFCLFSSYEGMPISLIEALATGTVPVCTPVGGIKNIIQDGVNGILSQDLSEEACYLALKRFLSLTKEQLKEMKENAINSYKPFTMEACALNYRKLFLDSLS